MLETKQESWMRLVGFVAGLPDENKNWAPFTAFVLPLLRSCVDSGLDQYFRVGQSMTLIIFSTAESHGLEKYKPPPPRVTLMRDNEVWVLAWSHRNLLSSAPERCETVGAENVFPTLKRYLTDLWRETLPNEPLPAPLM
jgi:hypothetical protein